MIFVALLYSQFDLNEKIQLDPQTTLIPLGYQGLRDVGHGCMAVGGFKFAYVQIGVPQTTTPLSNIGFTDTNVKTFLEFFSFITKDGHPIKEFEDRQEGTRYFTLEEEVSSFLDGECAHDTRTGMPVISNEFLIRDFPHVVGSINMGEAWVRFLSLENSFRDRVSLWCARLSGPMNGIYRVFNTDTVVLFFYVILIESLLDTRIKCSEILTCEKHGPTQIKHNLESTLDYWRSQLNEKLKFSDKSEYVKLVVSLYSQMRNPFAHAATLLSETESDVDPLASGPHTRFLRLPEVISNMHEDSLARSNARMLMHDIVWFLLLSSTFPGCLNEPWHDLGLIKEYRSYGAR